MPPLEDMDRHQWAVLWAATGRDKFNEITVAPPCQILVRWDWTKRFVRRADGTGQQIDADVLVGQEVSDGSLLWLGKLNDFDPAAITADNPLMQVVSRKQTKDLRGLFTARSVQLARYHRTLPQPTG